MKTARIVDGSDSGYFDTEGYFFDLTSNRIKTPKLASIGAMQGVSLHLLEKMERGITFYTNSGTDIAFCGSGHGVLNGVIQGYKLNTISSGTIKIANDNYLYIKKCFPISEVSRTSRPLALVRYSKTHFEKLYPSIGYYPWNRHKLSMDGETIQVDNLSKYVQNSIFGQEYKWFNSSSVKLLQQNFALFITNNGFGIDPNTPNFSLEDLIIQTISEHYEVPKEDAEYILSLYEWTSDWDYISPTNVNRYKYYIKLSLK